MSSNRSEPTNRIIIYVTFSLLFGLGLWLRWRFIQTVHPYPDEFVTLLAVQMIGQKGLPLMPSGLFYDHGLLFSYLGSLAALFGPAEIYARYASLLCGMSTIGLTFLIGRRWFSPSVGLLAVAGLTIAPTAIHWSGRARMYALLQLLALLTLWLAYEGISRNKTSWRWLALLAYLGATLTHFAAVTLALPLVVGAGVLWRLQRAEKQGNKAGATPLQLIKQYGAEIMALAAILLIAFLVKRAGQPKGIEALDGSNAVSGIVEVFTIYSDFSFDFMAGWQAIAPFYLTLPAAIFALFAVIAITAEGWKVGSRKMEDGRWKMEGGRWTFSILHSPFSILHPLSFQPSIYLAILLLLTTLEVILLVSPDRRDAKYIFMLLPVLLLLGTRGMGIVGHWLLVMSNWLLRTNYATRNMQYTTDNRYPAPHFTFHLLRFTPVLVIILILWLAKAEVEALLANTGDDYETAFAYVQAHWQEGDTVMTGTPAAAAFYLGRNDFYGVQKRGGYDYRLLTIEGQVVDRWLASPAIRAEDTLHKTLSEYNVWLVLERWGLQREYYDLPFQQQLLAQTEYQAEAQAQGIFVLHSKDNPQPLAVEPAQPVEAVFSDQVRLLGYTLEPSQPTAGQILRLTLYWQTLAPIPHDYTVFVHVRQPEGSPVAQADHRPLGELYPTTLWPVGETIRESSELFLPAGLAAGDYELWVGLYFFETGERLPVQHDTSGENAVRLGLVEVLE